MSTLALVIALVALAVSIAAALGVLMLRDALNAPLGCDACDGVNDCPSCGPVGGRQR